MKISQMVKRMRGEGIACSQWSVRRYLKGKCENRFTNCQYKRVLDYTYAVYHEDVIPHFKRKSEIKKEYRLKGMAKNEK
jgi:hypothetical protein